MDSPCKGTIFLAIHNAKVNEAGQEVLNECNEFRNLTLERLTHLSTSFYLHRIEIRLIFSFLDVLQMLFRLYDIFFQKSR